MYAWSIVTIGLGFIFLVVNIYLLFKEYKWILTNKGPLNQLGYNWLLIIASLLLFILGISSIFMINNQLS